MRKNNKILALKEKCEALHEELKIANNHWHFLVPVTLFDEGEFALFLANGDKREIELMLKNELYILEKARNELSPDEYGDDEEFDDVSDEDMLRATGGVF